MGPCVTAQVAFPEQGHWLIVGSWGPCQVLWIPVGQCYFTVSCPKLEV